MKRKVNLVKQVVKDEWIFLVLFVAFLGLGISLTITDGAVGSFCFGLAALTLSPPIWSAYLLAHEPGRDKENTEDKEK